LEEDRREDGRSAVHFGRYGRMDVMDVSKIFQTLTPPSPSSPAQPTTTTPIQGAAAAASSQDRLKDFLLNTSYLQNMDKEEQINFLRKIRESSIGQVKREKSS
jgi:hypothetical protein